MPSFDAIRMRHMREAAAAALEIAAAYKRPELPRNQVVAQALTRCLEILGEAAPKMTPEARLRFPAIPFVKMVSMRNRLIHAYFEVDLDVLWTTVTEDLPALLPALDAALAEIDR